VHWRRPKSQLIGKDPFSIEQLSGPLRYYVGNPRTVSALEIALWDLIGKAAVNPLQIWAPPRIGTGVCQHDPASTQRKGTHGSRAQIPRLEGDQVARAFTTLKEDVRLVEEVRKAVGDEHGIMVDANQANPLHLAAGRDMDFLRALQTARELERLNCLWLEEPRPRYAFDELAELSRLVASHRRGENNRGVHEYRGCWNKCLQHSATRCHGGDGVTGFREIATLAAAPPQASDSPSPAGEPRHHCPAPRHASWPHAPWIESCTTARRGHTHGFAMMENPQW